MAPRRDPKSGASKSVQSAYSSASRAGESKIGKARAMAQSGNKAHFQKFTKWTDKEVSDWSRAYKRGPAAAAKQRKAQMEADFGRAARYKGSRRR